MVSAYANSRALVVILSVLLLSWGTFANFTSANAAVLSCDGFVAIIIGTSGDDLINGTPGDDVIMGLAGNDIINGNGGDDIICSGSGSDVVTTESGDDYLHGEGGVDTFHAGDGSNTIDADFGNEGDVVTTGSGDDNILLGNGNDKVNAGDGNNNIETGGGDDTITSGSGNDNILGGSGNDTIINGSGDDDVDGNKGDDCINSGGGIDSIDGGAGNNTVNTGSCVATSSISIAEPTDGLISVYDSKITFTGMATDVEDGTLTSSIIWSSDLDDVIGSGGSFKLSTLSVGTHTITASVIDSDYNANSVSIIVIITAEGGEEKEEKDETSKKNELKEKRNELKEIQNEINQLKKNVKNDEELKDKVKELISDIKETLQTLKSDFDYDKEYKEELKTDFKEIKQKIYDDLTGPEKNSIHAVDSKISILSHSDDPKSDAKKLGLDYKNGKTTIAIQLTDDNNKVLHQLSSIGTIDAKNNNNVQITIKLKDLPKLSSIQGIENIRPPFPAVQFEESLSEGVYFMNADLAQYAGITGKGIKVAVLDLSFTNNPKISDNIVEVKSFRQGVSVLPDHWDGDEALHGTAVAEIIADVAPDVELFLYSMESDIEFAAAVDEAISKNVDIIAMSAGWPNFPTDGTSHITKKIEEAVENGIVFVVPAGNFGNKHWEGNFVDSNLNNWHDFSNT